jgi:hypothetical protein
MSLKVGELECPGQGYKTVLTPIPDNKAFIASPFHKLRANGLPSARSE